MQSVFPSLNGPPCLSEEVDSTEQTRDVEPIYRSPLECKHERDYFSQHPELNLFEKIKGYEVSERELLQLSGITQRLVDDNKY